MSWWKHSFKVDSDHKFFDTYLCRCWEQEDDVSGLERIVNGEERMAGERPTEEIILCEFRNIVIILTF